MYYFPGDERDSIIYQNIAALPQAQLDIGNFASDVENGKLAFYTFLMPSLLTAGVQADGNSMHPNADVRWGENYVAEIYNCLRNSKFWEQTLFIVTFDENGGIYDHVLPPRTVNPDGINSPSPDFDFTLLGPRVPAILISPWLDRGIDSTQYQNTSILRFVQDLMVPRSSPLPVSLTQRDAQAKSFAHLFNRDQPRTDCPLQIEGYGNIFNWPVGNIVGATDTSPIVITSVPDFPAPGSRVIITGAQGNTAANGAWTITRPLAVSLDNSNGLSGGDYTGGGTCTWPNSQSASITGATNTTPIVITFEAGSSSPPTGTTVTISGVSGNTAANGNWTITETSASFSLVADTNGRMSTGNGSYTGNGKWIPWLIVADDNQPPAAYTVDIAKEYAAILPGHPDSGKPITREFPTRAALLEYMQERRQAALRHYASAGG